jgi:hypothetical protein
MTGTQPRQPPRSCGGAYPLADPAGSLRAMLGKLDAHITTIILRLSRAGVLLDSARFAAGLTEIATTLSAFAVALGVPPPSSADPAEQAEPLLTAAETTYPPHRQQTLQVFRVLHRLNTHATAFADAANAEQRTAAITALADAAAVHSARFRCTARLMTVRSSHRTGRPVAEIAAELHLTEPDVHQLLDDAQAVLNGPLELPRTSTITRLPRTGRHHRTREIR